ncbi:hypothetical protein FACS189490_00810 [Clostridia bacterium]|nr:hypothetical protein FACS189490_00810 [Clostridia bacterium]
MMKKFSIKKVRGFALVLVMAFGLVAGLPNSRQMSVYAAAGDWVLVGDTYYPELCQCPSQCCGGIGYCVCAGFLSVEEYNKIFKGIDSQSTEIPVSAAKNWVLKGSKYYPRVCKCPGFCCKGDTSCHCAGSLNIDEYNRLIKEPEPRQTAETKKAIIILPGIVGSELWGYPTGSVVAGDMRKIWNPLSPLDWTGSNKTKIFDSLMVNNDGTSKNSTIIAKDDGTHGTILNGAGTYARLYEDLEALYGKSYTIEFFAYDWRLYNTGAAGLLEKQLLTNYSKEDEVILVCHSMGGIVASTYIAKYGSKKIDKLITIGTPYYGSPKALYVFETGRLMDDYSWSVVNSISTSATSEVFRRMIPNMPGVYDLLPSKRYFENLETKDYYLEYLKYHVFPRDAMDDVVKDELISRTSYNFSQSEKYMQSRRWFNKTVYDKIKDKDIQDSRDYVFDRIIAAPENVLDEKGNEIEYGLDAYIIAGYNTTTLSRLVYSNSPNKPDGLNTNKKGDGTVPLISSTLGYARTNRKLYYVDGVDHTGLVSNTYVIQLVKNIINGYGDRAENDPLSYDYLTGGIVSRELPKEFGKISYKITATGESVSLSTLDKNNRKLGTVSAEDFTYADGHHYDFYVAGTDNLTKIAFVDADSNIEIVGLGDGVMSLTIEKLDDENVVDTISYTDIPVAKNMIIRTDTNISVDAKLNVTVGKEKSTVYPDGSKAFNLTLHIGKREYTLNGESYIGDVAPIIRNDRTMVPLYIVSEAMGAEASWDGTSRTVTIKSDNKTLTLVVDVPLPNNMGTPIIVNDRTLVPIGYISEQLGAEAEWDNTTRSVNINRK